MMMILVGTGNAYLSIGWLGLIFDGWRGEETDSRDRESNQIEEEK